MLKVLFLIFLHTLVMVLQMIVIGNVMLIKD